MSDQAVALHIISTKALLMALAPDVRPNPHRGRRARVRERIIGHLQICQTTTWAELIEAVYGDDPEGGPNYAHQALYMAAWKLQKRGWPIRIVKSQGLWLQCDG